MNQASDWTVYRTRFLVRARKLTDHLQFTDALGRLQSGDPGDYLVEIFDGLLSITPRRFFEDIYVPLDTTLPNPALQPVIGRATTLAGNDGGSQPTKERVPPAPVHSRGSPLSERTPLVISRTPAERPASAALLA